MALMGEESGVYRVLVGKPEGKNHWGDLGVDGWIMKCLIIVDARCIHEDVR